MKKKPAIAMKCPDCGSDFATRDKRRTRCDACLKSAKAARESRAVRVGDTVGWVAEEADQAARGTVVYVGPPRIFCSNNEPSLGVKWGDGAVVFLAAHNVRLAEAVPAEGEVAS